MSIESEIQTEVAIADIWQQASADIRHIADAKLQSVHCCRSRARDCYTFCGAATSGSGLVPHRNRL